MPTNKLLIALVFLIACTWANTGHAACTGGPTNWICDNQPEAFQKVQAGTCPASGTVNQPVSGYTSTGVKSYEDDSVNNKIYLRCGHSGPTSPQRTVNASYTLTCAQTAPYVNSDYLLIGPSSPDGKSGCHRGCNATNDVTGPCTSTTDPFTGLVHSRCPVIITYTGGQCFTTPSARDLPDPDMPPPFTGWQCVPSAGICYSDYGNPNYCTFTSAGLPSRCVPFGNENDPEAPEAGDYDGDGVPDPTDNNPHTNDDNFDSDQDGIPDSFDSAPNDRTNGGGTTASSTSGGSCQQAPTCAGDPVGCNQLQQLWKMRCKVDQTVLTPNDPCNTAMQCTGDMMACAQLRTQRLAACKLQEIEAAGLGTGGGGPEAWGEATIFDALGLAGAGEGEGDIPGEEQVFSSETIDVNDLDDSGFFGASARTCPLIGLPEFEFRGESVALPIGMLCQALQVLGVMILLGAYLQAAYILGKFGGQ